MANVVMQVKGLNQLVVNLSRMGPIGRKWANKAIQQSILDVERVSKTITPIDSGTLRHSFDRSLTNLRGILRNYAPYSIYVHEGTSKWPLSSPPRNSHTVRQFMKEGIERSEKRILRNFQIAGDKTVQEMAGHRTFLF